MITGITYHLLLPIDEQEAVDVEPDIEGAGVEANGKVGHRPVK